MDTDLLNGCASELGSRTEMPAARARDGGSRGPVESRATGERRSTWWLMTGAALTALASLPGMAVAAAPPVKPWGNIDALKTGRIVPGPPGWLNYCFAAPMACRPGFDDGTVAATSDVLAIAAHVHQRVNREISAEAEPPGQDHWRLAPRSGDCEDYALTKQALLRAAGLPAAAVRLAVARLPQGDRHAVVTVATSQGTLVLDNLQSDVVPLSSLAGYVWLQIEQPGEFMRWQELQGLPDRTIPQRAPADRTDVPMAAAGAMPLGSVAQ